MSLQLIPPEQISTAKIKEIFDAAFMQTQTTNEGQVQVAEGGIKIFVSADQDKQLVRYFMLFGFKPGSRVQDQLELVNEINKNIVFLRAWSFGNGIAFDYALPFDGGVTSKQVVSAYRWLRKTTLASLQQYDHKNIVA